MRLAAVLVVLGALLGGGAALLLADGPTGPPPVVPGGEPGVGPDDGPNDLALGRAFLEGWWRSRTATYVAEGTFVRTRPDGAELRMSRVLVQRPPDVVLIQSGEVRATVDGAFVRCAVDPAGEQRCTEGGAAADPRLLAEAELARFAELLQGGDPDYRLTADGDCFVLERRRDLLVAPYGDRARVCFDASTGAVRRFRIERDGIVDDVVVDRAHGTVTDDDLTGLVAP